MTIKCGERVLETSTTTGTGSITLLGAVNGYQSFLLGVGDGLQTYYCITDGTNWEKGLGTHTSSGNSLSRDTVYESSTGGTKVDFPPGNKNVFSDPPANLFDGSLASQINALLLNGSTLSDILNRLNHTGITPVSGGGTGLATLTSGKILQGNGVGNVALNYGVETTLTGSSANVTRSDGVKSYIDSAVANAITTAQIPSGTRMLFHQNTAPTGWTKDTNSYYNDRSLRVVTGNRVDGGTVGVSGIFGGGKNTGSHAISVAEMPAHNHLNGVADNTDNFFVYGGTNVDMPGLATQDPSNADNGQIIQGYTSTVGSGNGHTHTLSLDLAYTDVIICQKN